MEKSFVSTIPFLSFQMQRILSEHEQDLNLWGGKTLEEIWKENSCGDETKNEVKNTYNKVLEVIRKMRQEPVDYSDFNPKYDFSGKKPQIVPDFLSPEKIMGRCPCPDMSDTLRCCNLKTLDAVQQCSFACSYCSIQSFYSNNQIRVVSDLKQHLENMTLDENVWHIGTGQSSDSLLLGDDYGTLTALDGFARKHPQIIIELKTKSARTDWLDLNLAPNIVSTWSVNADTFSRNEEHMAANVDARLEAAKKCAQKGRLIGFHIHPMCYFKGWKEEYGNLVKKIVSFADSKQTVMVGIGTLTFTKQNLRTIRESGRPTRVTHMDFEMIGGKFSYPLEIKKEMFSYVYNCFPEEWKKNVFFYLCMEDKNLWMPCLGREYASNDEFEMSMKASYLSKIDSLAKDKKEK